jgi:putative nucleotidyltransferase with HDIG domain
VRRVLFVDDQPQILEGLRDALRPCRREWKMTFAEGGEAALRELEAAEFDVVVTDMRMPGMDGADLLGHVQRLQPSAVRVVLSGYAEVQVIARAASVAHRFLSKPCDAEELRRVVERSCALREITASEPLRTAANAATALPVVPELYSQVTALLGDPDTSLRDVADVVARDVAMAAKVLQLANSAFFGRSRHIARLEEAVTFVGLNPLKALILSAESLAAFQPVVQVDGLSLASLERHANLTAQLARTMVADPVQREEAFAAALLHDIGVLVLLSFESELASEAAIAEHHAAVGAHLLELWGLPHGIVEAVAYHHHVGEVHDPIFDVTAAVAIAAALTADDGDAPALEPEYLERIGVGDRIEGWRAAARELAAA